MVLEGASGPQTDSYDNGNLTSDSPSSDMDPYASSAASSSSSTYNIDYATLSSPMPLLSYITGFSRPRFERMVVDGLNGTTRRLNRELTPDETQALAQAYAKAFSYGSWGDGLGVVAGWGKCYQRADTFKWPLGEKLRIQNPDVLGPLRGAAARTGWHALRSIPYGLLGWAILGSFGNAYAATVFMVTRGRDPRLKDVDKQLLDQLKQQNGQPVEYKDKDQPAPDFGTEKEQSDIQFGSMSPQSEADGALLSDNQMRIEESRLEEDARRPKPVEDRITTREGQRDWDKSWGAKRGDNDPRASKPVNDPLYGMSPAEKQAASGSSKESSWDRLRREAAERANK
jgi:hypothetical protein